MEARGIEHSEQSRDRQRDWCGNWEPDYIEFDRPQHELEHKFYSKPNQTPLKYLKKRMRFLFQSLQRE